MSLSDGVSGDRVHILTYAPRSKLHQVYNYTAAPVRRLIMARMAVGLLDLDDALLRRVLFFLPPHEVVQLLAVSRAMRYSLSEPTLWHKLNVAYFGLSELPLDSAAPLISLRANVRAATLRNVEWSNQLCTSKVPGVTPGPREGTAFATIEGGTVVVLIGGWGRGWPTIRNDLFTLDVCLLDEPAKAELVALSQASPAVSGSEGAADVTFAAAPHYERLRAAGMPLLSVDDTARWTAVRARGEPMRPRYGHSATSVSLPSPPGLTAGGASEGVLVFGGHFSGGYTAETASAHLICARVRTVVTASAGGVKGGPSTGPPPEASAPGPGRPSSAGAASSAAGGGGSSSAQHAPGGAAASAAALPTGDPAPWVVQRDVALAWEPLARRRGAVATPRGYHAALWVPALRATLVSGGISEGVSCWSLEALSLHTHVPGGSSSAETAAHHPAEEASAAEEAPAADTHATPAFELDAAPFPTSGAEPSPRHGHSMSLLPPTAASPLGSVWVFGGADGGDILREGTELRDLHVLDLASRAWTQPRLPDGAVPRWAGRCHSATVVGPKILVYGGSTRMTHRMFALDTRTLAITAPKVRLGAGVLRAPCGRYNHCTVRVGRQLLVFGGINRENRSLGDTHVLDLAPAPPAAPEAGVEAADSGDDEDEEDDGDEEGDEEEGGEEEGGGEQARGLLLRMFLQQLFAQAAQGGADATGVEDDDDDDDGDGPGVQDEDEA